jgi:hypothetical protein
MWQLFLDGNNIAFSVSLVLMLLIGLIELFSAGAASGVLDGIFPDIDMDIDVDIDIDADAEIEIPALSRLLGWIRPGKIPMLIYLIIFLMVFSLTGFIGQHIIKSVIRFYLPWIFAVPGAFFVAIIVSRFISLWASHIVIKDETTAVSSKSFIGRTATITIGTARIGCPAEAVLKDKHGQKHYVRVEPDEAAEFTKGTTILLVKKEQNNLFKCIKSTNINLQ